MGGVQMTGTLTTVGYLFHEMEVALTNRCYTTLDGAAVLERSLRSDLDYIEGLLLADQKEETDDTTKR